MEVELDGDEMGQEIAAYQVKRQQGWSLPHRAIWGRGIGPFGGQAYPGIASQVLWRGGQGVETIQGPAPRAHGVDEQINGRGGVRQRQGRAE